MINKSNFNNENDFNDLLNILREQFYDYSINNGFSKYNRRSKKNDIPCLTEEDFYPPSDNRVLTSYIEDVEGGDNFADYCEYIFNLYEEEGHYDN